MWSNRDVYCCQKRRPAAESPSPKPEAGVGRIACQCLPGSCYPRPKASKASKAPKVPKVPKLPQGDEEDPGEQEKQLPARPQILEAEQAPETKCRSQRRRGRTYTDTSCHLAGACTAECCRVCMTTPAATAAAISPQSRLRTSCKVCLAEDASDMSCSEHLST